MKVPSLIITIIILISLLSACGQSAQEAAMEQFKELQWDNLLPIDQINEEPQTRYGSLEIYDYSDLGQYSESESNGFFELQRQLSMSVVEELDGTEVRVPGFIVPIEFDGNLVSEFFLVPSFGACFHNPPPPPNQTIFVKSEKAIPFESIYDPVWALGVIKTQQADNEIATAAYSMDLHSIWPYAF